jgi:hypothetical protein
MHFKWLPISFGLNLEQSCRAKFYKSREGPHYVDKRVVNHSIPELSQKVHTYLLFTHTLHTKYTVPSDHTKAQPLIHLR